MAISHSNGATDNTVHAAKLFLDSEPEVNKPATALRLCPWWYKKELLNCCTRRKTELFFSSSPSVNNLQQFIFCAVKGGIRLSHHKTFTVFNVQKCLFVFSYVIWHYPFFYNTHSNVSFSFSNLILFKMDIIYMTEKYIFFFTQKIW